MVQVLPERVDDTAPSYLEHREGLSAQLDTIAEQLRLVNGGGGGAKHVAPPPQAGQAARPRAHRADARARHSVPRTMVSAGHTLVVLEAMKMEHTVASPIDGVLSALPAQVGHQVSSGDVLAVGAAVDGGEVASDATEH